MIKRLFLQAVVMLLWACKRNPTQAPATRTAPVRTSVAPLVHGTPGANTVTITGWAIDRETGEKIEDPEFLIVTIMGSYAFTSDFEVSFPSDTVFEVKVKSRMAAGAIRRYRRGRARSCRGLANMATIRCCTAR